jgi:hypothetical protein
MKYWERFANLKQRGEWVELQFMARAAQHCFAVSKPWGDTQAYDVGVEHGEDFLRVQVKSTIARSGAGYRCQFMPNHRKKHDYSLDQIDVFAAYVIPEDAWYLIPAVLLLGKRRRSMAMLCPVVEPAKKASYCYEGFREAWNLLNKSRSEMLEYAGGSKLRYETARRHAAPPTEDSITAERRENETTRARSQAQSAREERSSPKRRNPRMKQIGEIEKRDERSRRDHRK